MKALFATSWNDTDFVYNVEKDTWQVSDDVSVGPQHEADETDMDNAIACADREKAIFKKIELVEVAEAE